MSEEQTGKAKKPVSARRKKLRKQARKLAEKQGLAWKDMSKEDRKTVKGQVREKKVSRKAAKAGAKE